MKFNLQNGDNCDNLSPVICSCVYCIPLFGLETQKCVLWVRRCEFVRLTSESD